jgi:hypothetical protein
MSNRFTDLVREHYDPSSNDPAKQTFTGAVLDAERELRLEAGENADVIMLHSDFLRQMPVHTAIQVLARVAHQVIRTQEGARRANYFEQLVEMHNRADPTKFGAAVDKALKQIYREMQQDDAAKTIIGSKYADGLMLADLADAIIYALRGIVPEPKPETVQAA